jgi:hypothetical protein
MSCKKEIALHSNVYFSRGVPEVGGCHQNLMLVWRHVGHSSNIGAEGADIAASIYISCYTLAHRPTTMVQALNQNDTLPSAGGV